MWSKLIYLSGLIVSSYEFVSSQTIGDFSYDYWFVTQDVILKNDGTNILKLDDTELKNFSYPDILIKGESSSCIYDLKNKDFFFLIRNSFYKNDELISDRLIDAGTSSQGLLILPDIWNKNKLYLFSHRGFYSDLFYSVYNLESNVFEKFNERIVKDATERLHSIFVDNSFRIATTDKSGHLVTIVLDSLGLHDPKFHAKVIPNINNTAGRADLKFSNKGNQVAVMYYWQPSTIFLYKYDIDYFSTTPSAKTITLLLIASTTPPLV